MDTIELPKTYDPENAEKKWYPLWLQGKYFKPRKGKQNKTYTVIMPPPNVTGRLHMGHALDVTTQDALIRFMRMKGYEALWVPGTDHAGISTQVVVEKMLMQEEKKSRRDLGREKFVEKIWKWKEEYGGIITEQQRALGASADWDYSLFTMDPDANLAVRTAFVALFNEGLIYQSDYIVNWSTALQSAISDAEVEHKDVKGAFYHIHYKVKGEDTVLEVATTRPETLLGDTAVAVHPQDPRYQHLIGKKAIVPLCNREVPIIGDEHVDMEKGTGCLKVTPGHDFNDFEIGKRHKLPIITILNTDGTLNEHGLEFKGLSCKKARPLIVEKLKELGLFVKEEPLTHQVGHCERSGVVIEPLVSKQWFLNVQEMAQVAVKAVENDETRFYPKGWENTYFSWLKDPKDWCISRQLWWGHQIPVFYCDSCKYHFASIHDEKECPKCKSHLRQDPDVLDTWFSSGLWPFSTLGWPIKEKMERLGFERFFSTTTLITGYDIIFFWVARMMMMSLKFTKSIPFEKVYIHALVRDKQGRKMSKSLGNGIDPLEMIKTYGADALRFTLAAGSGYNRNLNLDPERIEGYRNFINKIWNAYRFISPHLHYAKDQLPASLGHHDKWILSELSSVTKIMNESMVEFRFDDSCSAIYAFVYEKFCSWYIELTKNIFSGEDEAAKVRVATVLKYTFKKIMALLHPMTPFITEELWAHLKSASDDLLIVQEYPEFDPKLSFVEEQEQMNRFVEVVTLIRNLRMSVNIKPKDEIDVSLFSDEQGILDYFKKNETFLKDLARVKVLTVSPKSGTRPLKSLVAATSFCEIFLPLEGVIDLKDQIARLNKEIQGAENEWNKQNAKISNSNFAANAPAEVVAEVRAKADELKKKIDSLKANLERFS